MGAVAQEYAYYSRTMLLLVPAAGLAAQAGNSCVAPNGQAGLCQQLIVLHMARVHINIHL